MGKKYRLDTEFEMLGKFSLPGHSLDNGIAGKVIFKNNKLKLEIYGDLEDLKPSKDENGVQYYEGLKNEEYIVGFSNTGYTILIKNATCRYKKFNFPGIPYSEYTMTSCLFMEINYSQFKYTLDEWTTKVTTIGLENIECLSCNFSFRGLEKWMNSSVIKRALIDKKTHVYKDMNLVPQDKVSIENTSLVFSNYVICNELDTGFVEEHFWRLENNDKSKDTLTNLKKNVDYFRKLIQLLVKTPVEYTVVDFNLSIKNIFGFPIRVNYIYSQPNYNKPMNISVNYQDIRDEFNTVLNNWFNKKEKLTLIISNYLNDINTNYFSEAKLLNSIRNLEMYHRNFIDDTKKLSIDENLNSDKEKLIEYINTNIFDEKYKKRFIRNIEYNPEVPLRNRIKYLLKELDESIKENFIKLPGKNMKSSIDSITNSLVQTRNYYTHGDDVENYPQAITGTIEQLNMTSTLNQIIKYYIFKELGMLNKNKEIINKIIEGRRRYGG